MCPKVLPSRLTARVIPRFPELEPREINRLLLISFCLARERFANCAIIVTIGDARWEGHHNH
jgi:hypothetical protein